MNLVFAWNYSDSLLSLSFLPHFTVYDLEFYPQNSFETRFKKIAEQAQARQNKKLSSESVKTPSKPGPPIAKSTPQPSKMVLKSPPPAPPAPPPEKIVVVDQVVETSSEAESESELDLSYDNAIEDLKGQVN